MIDKQILNFMQILCNAQDKIIPRIIQVLVCTSSINLGCKSPLKKLSDTPVVTCSRLRKAVAYYPALE